MIPIVVALASAPAVARAAATACPSPTGADARLRQIDSRARLAFIDRLLTDEAHRARLWAWGWGGGIGVAGVASLAAVPFVAPENRVDWYTSAASAAVGVIPFALFPLPVLHDAPGVHAAALASAGADDDARVCRWLGEAEEALARNAAAEARQRAWWVHGGNVAFNTGVLLFLGLGYHHWASAIINGATGLAVGEAIILTSPTQSIDDLAAYRRGAVTAAGATGSATAWSWTLTAAF